MIGHRGGAARFVRLPTFIDYRQRYMNGGALPSLAFRPHPTVLSLNEIFRDVEPESESPPIMFGDLTKTFEDCLGQMRGDPNSGVTNRQVD